MPSPRHNRTSTVLLASTFVAGLLALSVGPAAGQATARASVTSVTQSDSPTVTRSGAALSALTGQDLTAAGHVRAAPPQAVAADDGATVAGSVWKDKRMLDITVKSPAVGGSVPVRLLMPPGWSATATRTWPVLYLLQGAHADYTSWTLGTNIESFSADKNMIVAMPGSGPTGLPTRWLNGGRNSPDYEAFQVTELQQVLERGYRASSVRDVAGISTGGYGALIMAAHYPGTFRAAASYSGIPDTTYPGMPEVIGAIVARENLQLDQLWGDPVGDAAYWAQENPYAQADQLRSTPLFISCGSGQAPGPSSTVGQVLERALWVPTHELTNRLSQLGIHAQTDLYNGGTHDWSSWQGEFVKSWPMLAAGLGLS